ncbi:hypothetical protein EW146_g7700 [Bondarzewia mesenterica]|uniref:RING-type E3 ubiquitin transferase n=1 Tax=Bondarzewia mesenterica TaxID=1095465 RepID=A0A4S4LQP8_9AGAM|nr:hypothetical protein EW146_g7700 [Bondarzewia mesenterica]
MQEELDTCRICSAPAEPDQPLFHPCKCSGTIRYIHQDCLTTWLTHSKKKTCDVCKHPYAFTKVYAQDMPRHIPVILLLQRFIQHALFAILFCLRAVVVALVWLAVLPWVTIWTWRMYFAIGNSTAWWISARARAAAPASMSFFYNLTARAHSSANTTVLPSPSSDEPRSSLTLIVTHPLLRTISKDIFTGQIIATLIVLAFIAVFLLREWISQNARPGVFEDGDLLAEGEEQEEREREVAREREQEQEREREREQEQERERQMQMQRVAPPEPIRLPQIERPMKNFAYAWKVDKKGKGKEKQVGDGVSRQWLPWPPEGRDPERLKSLLAQWAANATLQAFAEQAMSVSILRDYETCEMERLGIMNAFRLPSEDAASDRQYYLRGLKPLKPPPPVFDEGQQPFNDCERRHHLRRRLLYERLREEREAEGEEPIPFPDELVDVSLEPDRQSVSEVSRQLLARRSPDVVRAHTAFGGRGSYGRRWASSLEEEKVAEWPSSDPPRIPFQDDDALDDSQSSVSTGPSRPTVVHNAPTGDFTFAVPAQTTGKLFSMKPSPPLPYPIVATPAPPLAAFSPSPDSTSMTIPVPRRPPMLSATLPSPMTPPVGSSSQRNKEQTPLLSPSLATYRPPEELQETGYFDTSGEYARFFQDPPDDINESQTIDTDMGKDNTEEGPALPSESDEDEEEVEQVDEPGPGLRHIVWAQPEQMEEDADFREDVEDEADAEAEGEGEVRGEDGVLAAEVADDLDMNVEDDMEGALEAIGMRGPLYTVAQNAALMIFVLDTAIGLGVWLPYTLGKSTALLSLDPRRALHILHWPIRIMRVITDPITDSVLFLIGGVVLPTVFRITRKLFVVVLWPSLRWFLNQMHYVVADEYYDAAKSFCDQLREQPWELVSEYLAHSRLSSSQGTEPSMSLSSIIEDLLNSDYPIVQLLEPHFAAFGREVRITTENTKEVWTRFALGDGNAEKVFAVALGYAVVGIMLAFYLNVLTVGTVKSAGRAIRNAVRQQLLVIKVAAFIVVELVIFPLGCGINLDLCSIWLFPEASLQSRVSFFRYAPLTATFYHWVVGTMFMYQFAILLAGCRTVMRPGAMWFIKDPSDQNFHPIRDILERPALVQIRKLSVSAVMYGMVVACGVGTIGGIMRLSSTVLPLRWKPREPLSDVPVDLLFLHVVLPYTMRFFRPKKILRKVSLKVWKYLCARLRLTSYMFGERSPAEEFTTQQWTWLPSNKTDSQVADAVHPFDGSFRRVPASDNVAIPRDMRATAEVDVNGNPVDEESQRLINAQNAEAEKAKRNYKNDYTVVYIPPHFRYRIVIFILALWLIGSVFLATVITTPIQIGRNFFRMFTAREIHDGYSFLVGLYTLWGGWVIGYAVERMDRRRQRRGADEPRAQWPLYFAKRSFLWLAKVSYMFFFLGIVIPILIALVVELYISLPIRYTLKPDLVPRIRIVDMWAFGVVYAKIALRVQRLQPPNRLTAGILSIKQHGWTNPSPISATRQVIAPLMIGLSGMLVLPPLVALVFQRLLPSGINDDYLLMHVYPGLFAAAGATKMTMAITDILSSWSQSIRDKEFLVELRLRNFQQEKTDEDRKEGVGEVPAS